MSDKLHEKFKDSLQLNDTALPTFAETTCLDSPMSVASPVNEKDLKKFSLIRKLGAAETVYDYEHTLGNVLLSDAFKIESNIDPINLYITKPRIIIHSAKLLIK